ncbi:MAG: elongation factor Ts [Alphaproteobacteria bacterium]|nr:elongation factor Ts [Alphaproteobacteria bacterium]
MAEITASLVKDLREKTGAGMMDCKKALNETAGDLEAAVDWLRKKGLAAAAKKAGRVAAEGLVALAVEGNRGALVEVNSETDFVARNETFQGFVETVAKLALKSGADVEKLKAVAYPGAGRTVGEELTHLISTIGENMTLRRAAVIEIGKGLLGGYVHNAIRPGLGKIGALVAIETGLDSGKIGDTAKQVAMHVAAANPQSVSRESLDKSAIERERSVLSEQARASGKAEDIIAKMVEGRLRKFYEEVCLVDQVFIIDGESRVGAALEKAAKTAGGQAQIREFARFALGEGIEREQADFAAEVAAAAGH